MHSWTGRSVTPGASFWADITCAVVTVETTRINSTIYLALAASSAAASAALLARTPTSLALVLSNRSL